MQLQNPTFPVNTPVLLIDSCEIRAMHAFEYKRNQYRLVDLKAISTLKFLLNGQYKRIIEDPWFRLGEYVTPVASALTIRYHW
jgi:hypothetical protein